MVPQENLIHRTTFKIDPPLKAMERRLELDGWNSGIKFSACHMLLRHDKCSRLHGHSYCIHLRIFGSMNKDNMLMDFGSIKKVLRNFANDLDHMILIPTGNKEISINTNDIEGTVSVDMAGKRYMFPSSDVKYLPIPTTTVEELSKYILLRLIDEFDFQDNITRIELGIDEGLGQGAWASKGTKGE